MNLNESVIEIIYNLCGDDNIELESRLQDDLGLDSLLMVTMLVVLEETFDVQLDESDMNPFDLVTVSDVIALAEKYCGG